MTLIPRDSAAAVSPILFNTLHQQVDNRILHQTINCFEYPLRNVSMHARRHPIPSSAPAHWSSNDSSFNYLLQLVILFHYQALGPANTLPNQTLKEPSDVLSQRMCFPESAHQLCSCMSYWLNIPSRLGTRDERKTFCRSFGRR